LSTNTCLNRTLSVGPDFTLIGLNQDPSFALPPEDQARWKRLASRHLNLVRPSTRAPLREGEVMDVDGVFFASLGEKASGFCPG
jgi:hypothetical protein